ncbi:hypothetical protein CEP54_015172 [Fusarium duplospermum]|uniref:Sulfatase n=1 Tax=Fusarium duplospermum TaxID=1325734 RepID=A0A428NQZ5_9HYPO|nr:hypothetical protein CEP54_015172 [Fusarium duplospermum]
MASTKQPNVIFIMADDHTSKAISCYGHGIDHTPHMDRIANEGARFNHCYVTNSICTPSRAAILCGTYNHTAMVGKWHLGEGERATPTGFDYWSVVPGQGEYWDPQFIEPSGMTRTAGYATDIITDKSLEWLDHRDRSKPFFFMCHHKALHRSWEYDSRKHKELYKDLIRLPETFTDDYKNRARAAKVAKMRVAEDLTYNDLGLVQPDGPSSSVGDKMMDFWWFTERKVPSPSVEELAGFKLICKDDGTVYTFKTTNELAEFKFQRYMQRYLRTIQSVDDNVGRLLEWLDQENLAHDTIVVYTSDQGFFMGEHGWFDKRFMYEESFQMPFLLRYPAMVKLKTVYDDIICNVDFAATLLDLCGVQVPSYMQGRTFRPLLEASALRGGDGRTMPLREGWPQVAYHRYWMNRDPIHEAYAHYGLRDQRYKLIYWYCEDLGQKGARPGIEGEEKEWELFDCEQDPLELFNVYEDPKYQDVVKTMRGLLDKKMAEIGDEPQHKVLNL